MNKTQSGGIKIIFHDTKLPVMNREITSLDGVIPILDNTRNIEVVSTGSLNSFVFRLHLNPEHILFRSNTTDTKTSRFTRQSFSISNRSLFSKKPIPLTPNKAYDENEGLPVHEIIMKVSVINPPLDQRGNQTSAKFNIQKFKSKEKASLSEVEFSNEYYTQRYLYSSMMSVSGNPFCPDAFGLYITKNSENSSVLSLFAHIQTIASTNPILKDIVEYLVTHMSANYRIGFIFMESIPSSYRSVYSFRVDPNYDKNVYKKVCEGISAINILTVYRGMCFHLDAHSGNWLFNPFEKLTEQVKEIDFGRVYRIDTDTNMRKFLIDLKENMKEYFESLYKSNQYIAVNLLHLFFYTMGRVEAEIRQYITEQQFEKKIMYAELLIENEVRRMIDDFRENEYFSKPYMSLSREESAMNIKMIHRIILIYIYVDFFYNTQYRLRQGQIAHIYNIIFKTNILNIETISNLNLRLDLDEHNALNPSNATLILQIYKRIYNIIYKFNEDRNFGNIRNYQRFKEFHYTNAQKAWSKIRQIAAYVYNFPLTKATLSGISTCTSAICDAATRASYGVARYAKDKSLAALTNLRSSITGYNPPSVKEPKIYASSPKEGYVVTRTPLVYGGSRRTKRSVYRKRHTQRKRHTRGHK